MLIRVIAAGLLAASCSVSASSRDGSDSAAGDADPSEDGGDSTVPSDGGAGTTPGDGVGGMMGEPPEPSQIPPGEWIAVTAGSFTMGAPSSESCFTSNNQTPHTVTLTRGFEMSATEVTQAEFAAMMGYSQHPDGHHCGEQCPVVMTTWDQAAAYCNALSAHAAMPSCYQCSGSGSAVSCEPIGDPYACYGYRLPSEAEWEYAYRAGSSSAVYNGNLSQCGSLDAGLDAIAWFLYNAGGEPHLVASKAPNAWGFYDMAGNVWEWVHDGYQSLLPDAVDPAVPSSDGARVMRGGSYNCIPGELRAAHRSGLPKTISGLNVGFRCARTLY